MLMQKLLVSIISLRLVSSQFSFIVQFPIVRDVKDQPHVDCSSKDYTKSPPVEYLPKTGIDAATGNPLGTCRACTAENYCVNEFRIKTVAFDAFTGLTTDVTLCQPTDINGRVVDLTANVYSIVLQTKAPTFSAPQGKAITNLASSLKVASPIRIEYKLERLFDDSFIIRSASTEYGWCRTQPQLPDNISSP